MSADSIQSLSAILTPIEIKNKDFKKMVWGYAPQEVVEFLDATAKAWEKVQKHEKDLIEEIKSLNEELAGWKARESEFQGLKVKAALEATQIKTQAVEESERCLMEVHQRAEEIRVRTEQWLEGVIHEVEETERRRNSFITAFRSALDQHYALLDTDQKASLALQSNLTKFLNDHQAKMNPSDAPVDLESDRRLS